MRLRDVAALAVVVVSLSCTDAPSSSGSSLATGPGSANLSDDLNTVEGLIAALFPTGMENAALQRWVATEAALARGSSRIAQQHMMQLADFVLKMEGNERLDDPDGADAMTVNDGVMRLIALMFARVNPGQPAPPTNLSGDFVVAVVDGSHQTVVTPAQFAGVEFPAGAAPEPFLLVIKESEFRSFEPCQGPLRTRLCQYPRFYEFHPFPYTVLRRVAAFGVCHVTEGPLAPNKDAHERMRLAHDAPPTAPRKGYVTVDGAEILPFARTDFLECHPHLGVIDRIAELLLPKKAYAIDVGGGGGSDFFSNFNVVDPQIPPSRDNQ